MVSRCGGREQCMTSATGAAVSGKCTLERPREGAVEDAGDAGQDGPPSSSDDNRSAAAAAGESESLRARLMDMLAELAVRPAFEERICNSDRSVAR